MATRVKKEPELPAFEYVDIDSIQPAEYNPRTISPAHLRNLKQSLSEFGWAMPITVNFRTKEHGWEGDSVGMRVIVGGHQRVRAARELGMTEVPVIWVQYDETKEKAANIALNNNEMAGEWDTKKLAIMLEQLKEADSAMLRATGFKDQQVQQFLKALEDVPDAPVYPLTPMMSEKYDCVIILTSSEVEFVHLQQLLGLKKKQNYKKASEAGLGMSRVMNFDEFTDAWNARS